MPEKEILIDWRTNFFRVSNEIFEYNLTPKEITVYTLLCRYANNNNTESFPSYEHISEKTGMGRTTTYKAVSVLCNKGLIKKISGRKGKSNRYYLLDLRSSEYELSKEDIVHIVNVPSTHSEPTPVQHVNSKKTYIKKTKEKDLSISAKAEKEDPEKVLMKEKSDKLFSWAYNLAKENNRLPLNEAQKKRWVFANKKLAKDWVNHYIDDLDAIRKIMDYCEDDPYWSSNFKSLNQFETMKGQLQDQYFKSNNQRRR